MTGINLKLKILAALIMVFLFSACATTVIISENLSPAELIQRAQEASDRNRYSVAMQYYEALYQRNQTNLDLIITSEYEIAFIYYKQKKYDMAREKLGQVLEYYNTPDEELLPPHFKKLAQIVLKNIDEKDKSSSKTSAQKKEDNE
ncbi:MAG: hypothetical protein FWC03_07180 [Treponema sp.]|nr:hypothetical protein [Treponema sp.]